MINFLIIAFTSSFCSMSFSMIMALLMSEFTGEEVLTQCLTLGPYLLGLGFGSAWGDKIKDENKLIRLFQIEWASIFILPVIPLLQLLGIFLFVNLSSGQINPESPQTLIVLLSITAVLAFISGLLGGSQLPLILRACRRIRGEIILAINYLGPLFAGIMIATLSGNAMGFGMQIYLIGIIQITGLFFLLFNFPNRTKSILTLPIPLLVVFICAQTYPRLETITVKSAYMNTRANGLSDILNPSSLIKVIENYGVFQRVRTSYQTIDFFMEPGSPEIGIPGNSTLYLNRKPQFDLFSVDVYHQTMIDGGINLLKHTPKRVLILGAGDGLLLKEFQKYKAIEEIIMVELDQAMLQWSNENTIISQLNQGVLANPPANSKIFAMDGITYLRNNSEKFDLILVDFPFPNGQELAKLYSFEFYTLVKRSLKEDGLVMVDLPLYLGEDGKLSKESRVILKTMDAAGFKNRLLMGPNASFVAMKTQGEKLKFDYSNFSSDLSLSTVFNLVAPFSDEQFTEKDKVNAMFWSGAL